MTKEQLHREYRSILDYVFTSMPECPLAEFVKEVLAFHAEQSKKEYLGDKYDPNKYPTRYNK